uniref:Uncharacterized protein n=1 Tax=Amphimedon queenslandica TaxID=400682 RepID=A0A1X7V1Y2_AMPQE
MSSSQDAYRLCRNERNRERRSATEEEKRMRRDKRNARDRSLRAQKQQTESPFEKIDHLYVERARIQGMREQEDPGVREQRLTLGKVALEVDNNNTVTHASLQY